MNYLQILGPLTRKLNPNQWPVCERAIQQPWVVRSIFSSHGLSSNNDLKLHGRRSFCQDTRPRKMHLMDFPLIVWPNIIKTIKNWIYTTLIIRPYLDPEFNLTAFVEGSKLAAAVVSNRLAAGKLSELEGLVTPDCLEALQKNISVLNAKQRQEIGLSEKDIYFSFPYELGILFEEAQTASGSMQKRYVEITMVHHVLRGHQEMIDRGEQIPLNIGVMPEFREKLFILNYRYIREYSKGVSDQWTLNIVNHFKPGEFAQN